MLKAAVKLVSKSSKSAAAPAQKHPGYRPDIDGLRAVAIGPVVLFHLGFSWFSGGYVGVDVFFVISGYLITQVVYREVSAGSFTFTRFYERRVRRLFPALFVTLGAVTILSALLLLPGDLKSFSQSLAAGAVFLANVFFRHTAGYFDGPAEYKPLLHIWSLSVEEQFYIFFPALLLIMHRLQPRRIVSMIFVLAIASLAASTVAVRVHPDAAFYLPAYRAWELFVGALLALGAVRAIDSKAWREVIAVLGIAMIGWAVFMFTSRTPFPGASALLPVIGSAMLIHAGSSGQTAVGKLLSHRVPVLIGLISYSLYLWHWPLIVFAKYYLLREPLLIEKLAIIAAATTLALLTWRYVEAPFRGRNGLLTRKSLFAYSAAGIAAFVALGVAGNFAHGLPGRLPPAVRSIAKDGRTFPDPRCLQGKTPEQSLQRPQCHLGVAGAPTFVFWGDSHAVALAHAIDEAARQRGVAGVLATKFGCPPLLGVERHARNERNCRPFNDRVAAFIQSHPQIRYVIMDSRWATSATGKDYGVTRFALQATAGDDNGKNAATFRDGLARTFHFLNARGIVPVFVEQVPEIGWNVGSTMARAQWYGRPMLPPAPTLAQYEARQKNVDDALTALSGTAHFQVLRVHDLFCSSGTCAVERDGRPLYRDSHHLSELGAGLLEPRLASVLPSGN